VGGNGNDGLNCRNFSPSTEYSTIMMGNDSLYFNYGDGARGEIITDDANNVYVGSTTRSTNFPVTDGCIQSHNRGRQEGVVFKIDYNLSHLIWSTYLGGNKDDAVYSIDCDREYNVVACGGTNSYNFPTTPGAYRTYYSGGSADGFVAKISYHGKSLMASTQYGSPAYDQCYFVRCAKNNDIFIFGQTKATGSTLVHNANYNVPNSGQMLARFKPGLDTLVWSTVFGTGDVDVNGPNISPTAFAVDICNRVYLSGWGRIFLGLSYNGVNYPWNTHGTSGMSVTPDAYQSVTDGQDFYLMAMDIDANSMVYATYFGEQHNSSQGYRSGQDHVDGGTSRFDRLGTIYQSVCASCGGSDNFPTTQGAYGLHNNCDNCNNAIFRLNLTDDFPVADFTYTRTNPCNPTTIEFKNTGRGTSYLWDFGDGTTSTQTNPTHNYTTPGVYTIRLIAYMPGGCSESDTTEKEITIVSDVNDSQNFAYLDTLRICSGTPVQIGLRPEAGLTYKWTQGEVSDSNIANPMAEETGTYILYVSSETPCTTRFEQVIVAKDLDMRLIGDTLTCSIPDTLNIEAYGDGLTYLWSSTSNFADTLNSDMSSGEDVYTPADGMKLYCKTTDELGCFGEDSIQIHFYEVIDSLIISHPSCPGDCTGNVCVVPLMANAVPPLQYNWGSGWTGTNCKGLFCDGDHTVLFRDGNGCAVTNNFTIISPDTPVITSDVTHILCLESCTGSINITVTGPSSDYTLLWLDDSSTTATRTDLCAGEYILQVSDENGCLFFDTIEILENVDISVDITNSQNSCNDLCSGTATALASGGNPPYTYVWSSGEQGATATALCPGTAIVVATDSNGCEVRDSITIGLQHSFDSITVWADAEYVFNNQGTMLHVTQIPGGSYYWMPSNLLSSPSSPNTYATLTDTTVFVVTVTDSLGCTYTDSVKVSCITVNCGKPNIFIPNAFTPNNDGKNDVLCFSGEWVQEFHIAIFTRWGEKIYESDNINECWDGRYKNNWCMPGVYVYHCRIKCEDGQKAQFKGDVTLIR
jgi:gliding motility-associated-like protein